MRNKKVPLILGLLCGLPVFAAGGGEHGFDVVLFAAKVLNFVIFFGALFHVLKKPVGAFFVNRRKEIEDSLELAEKSREEATRRLEEIESKMANLDAELAEIEAQARKDAQREKDRIQAQAEEDANRILEQAKVDVETMRRNAMNELRQFISELAVSEAESRLAKSLTDEERRKLFVQFSDKLGAAS